MSLVVVIFMVHVTCLAFMWLLAAHAPEMPSELQAWEQALDEAEHRRHLGIGVGDANDMTAA